MHQQGDFQDHGGGGYGSSYGYSSYGNFPQSEQGIKGKVEKKYWRTKQKVIEKLGKDQDEFIIAGDAEVDARLEAFNHIHGTCMNLLYALEMYQARIFALSQDENEMGRFLKEHGTTDKTKAGKMMIAVGKALSFSAQQRLSLRQPLVRIHQEVETFRCRAVADTSITVEKMETTRSEYRAKMLWMADISKEIDPDVNKRLDKFKDVQQQVKDSKRRFEKLKHDVLQKIDLLSASRCNLLSATLEPYQQAMTEYLVSTTKSYNEVYQQFEGYPSYQFHILKHIMPNNGIVDDDDEGDYRKKKSLKKTTQKSDDDDTEEAEDATNETDNSQEDHTNSRENPTGSHEPENTLINFDESPVMEKIPPKVLTESDRAVTGDDTAINTKSIESKKQTGVDDLLNFSSEDGSPGFGDYTSTGSLNGCKSYAQQVKESIENDGLLGKFEENNLLVNGLPGDGDRSRVDKARVPPSIDDLLSGSPTHKLWTDEKVTEENEFDMLSDILSNQALNDQANSNSFSSEWNSMFGAETGSTGTADSGTETMKSSEHESQFMPSFLMDQLVQQTPSDQPTQGMPFSLYPPTKPPISGRPAGPSNTPPPAGRKQPTRKDMSPWFDLFADLDPLSNPDAVGKDKGQSAEKQAC